MVAFWQKGSSVAFQQWQTLCIPWQQRTGGFACAIAGYQGSLLVVWLRGLVAGWWLWQWLGPSTSHLGPGVCQLSPAQKTKQKKKHCQPLLSCIWYWLQLGDGESVVGVVVFLKVLKLYHAYLVVWLVTQTRLIIRFKVRWEFHPRSNEIAILHSSGHSHIILNNFLLFQCQCLCQCPSLAYFMLLCSYVTWAGSEEVFLLTFSENHLPAKDKGWELMTQEAFTALFFQLPVT